MFTEKEVYDALGLGAQVQEPADPAAQASTVDTEGVGDNAGADGAQVQEPADPAQVDDQTVPASGSEAGAGYADPEDPENNAETGTGTEKKPMSAEERRANAARRREQEQKAAVNSAVAAAVKAEQDKNAAALESLFSQMKLKDTFTGQPITTMDQFNSWQQKFRQEQMQKDLKAGILTPEALQQAISEHPAIKEAERIVQEGKDAQQREKVAAARAKIDADIVEINKIDPSIKSLQDLVTMPKAAQFREKVNRGYGILDAFKLVHQEEHDAKVAEAARQQALTNSRGKDHLSATGSARGTGARSVPSAELEMYKLINPSASDAQIQSHYNKYKK